MTTSTLHSRNFCGLVTLQQEVSLAGHVLQLFAYTRKLFLGLQRAAICFQEVVAVLLDGCAHLSSCLDY